MIIDTQLITEIQFLLVEAQDPTRWSSGMWTPDETETYLDNSQQDLFVSAAPVISRLATPTTPNLLRQPMPADWIATWDLAWQDASSGAWYPLERAETWDLDALIPDWRYTPGRPRFWTEADGQTLTVQIVPAPLGAGQLEFLYLANPAPLGHAGAAITAPDDFAPGIVWGAVSRMLSKIGRASDPSRAALAKQLGDLPTEAAKLILMGRP